MASTQTSYRTTVFLAGVLMGEATHLTGGVFDSNETKLVTAAGQAERALGGRPTASNVTAEVPYDPAVHDLHWIVSQRNQPMVVNRQKLDDDESPVGTPMVFTGKFKALHLVDVDLNGNNPDFLGFEQSTDGVPS